MTGLLHLIAVSPANGLVMSIVYRAQHNRHKICLKTPLHTMNGHSVLVPLMSVMPLLSVGSEQECAFSRDKVQQQLGLEDTIREHSCLDRE